jgi:CBS domain containing-hemolysin-like protein
MTPVVSLILVLWGALFATWGATAAQVLHEFARHELEVYCHRRQRRQWFDAIIQNREKFALGAETLQMLGISLLIVGGLNIFIPKVAVGELGSLSSLVIVLLATLVLLICNSWIPWGVAHFASAPFLFHTWRFWWVVAIVTWPVTIGVRMFSGLTRRISGKEEISEDEEQIFEDEIRSMASEGERGGWLEARVRDMLEGVLDLDDTAVAKVMTPRSRVDSLEVNTDWEVMLKFVVETERTRLPVYRQTLNNVIGILYTKDLLTEFLKPKEQRRPLDKLVRKPIYVPESTRLDVMLRKFLQSRVHMAIVHDEYEAVSGIVTIEDILEEIVGEIQDETDIAEPITIERIAENEFRIAGTTLVENVNRELGLQLPEDEDFDSVAGLVLSLLHEIPKRGQKVVIGNAEFEIQQATQRSIEQFKVRILDETAPAAN